MLPFVIALGVGLAVAGVVGVWAWKAALGRSEAVLREIARVARAPVDKKVLSMEASVAGTCGELPFSCRYAPRDGPRRLVLTTTLRIPQRASFTLRRRSGFDAFCSATGLAKPVSTGDARFDERFYADAADGEEAARILGDDGLRRRAVRLLEDKTARLHFGPGGISLSWQHPGSEKAFQPPRGEDWPVPAETLVQVLDGLRELASPERKGGFAFYGEEPDPAKYRGRWLIPCLFLLAGGFVLWLAGATAYTPLFRSFPAMAARSVPYGLGALGIYGIFAWLAVRRRTDRHLVVGALAALGVPAFCLASVGIFYFANGFLDTSRPVERTASVARVSSEAMTGRRIRFQMDGAITAKIPRPRGDFHSGQPVRLVVRDGWLGVKWVSEWRATDK